MQRIKKVTVTKNQPTDNGGCGLMIDTEPTFDTELLPFLSKIIDYRARSTVRQIQRVHRTGNVTSSKVPMPQINQAVYEQLEEYAEIPLFKKSIQVRSEIQREKANIKDTKY